MDTLNYIRNRRMWLVRDYNVWGASSQIALDYITVESLNGEQRILFASDAITGASQEVLFGDLVDHRGNALPDSITNPKVIPVSKSNGGVKILGSEYSAGFRIAKTENSQHAVTTDLLIVEMS